MQDGINIKIDDTATRKALTKLQKKQYPFALAHALTLAARDGQRAVIGRTKRKFELHGRHTIKNVKVQNAKKTDVVHKHLAYSAVYTGKNIPYMPQHETSAIKTPKYEKYVAVPASDMKKKRYRTSRGVKQKWHPEHLMQQSILAKRSNRGGPRPTGKGRSKQKNAFIIESTKKRTPIMVRRRTMKRTPLEFLWVLKKRVKIKRTWSFYTTVDRRVSRTFDKHFRTAMRYAVKTAR